MSHRCQAVGVRPRLDLFSHHDQPFLMTARKLPVRGWVIERMKSSLRERFPNIGRYDMGFEQRAGRVLIPGDDAAQGKPSGPATNATGDRHPHQASDQFPGRS